MKNRYRQNDNKCINCKKIIDDRATRCHKCYLKTIKGINHPNYKDGRSSKKKFCIVCGRKITWQAIKCGSCSKRGINNPHYGKKTSYPKWKKFKGILMRSSYEIIYAKYLRKHHIHWRYEYKTFDLGNTTYTPDFYLPETDTYIEIKGWWRIRDLCKYMRFKKRYKNIKIKVINKRFFNQIPDKLVI